MFISMYCTVLLILMHIQMSKYQVKCFFHFWISWATMAVWSKFLPFQTPNRNIESLWTIVKRTSETSPWKHCLFWDDKHFYTIGFKQAENQVNSINWSNSHQHLSKQTLWQNKAALLTAPSESNLTVTAHKAQLPASRSLSLWYLCLVCEFLMWTPPFFLLSFYLSPSL